MRMLTLGPVAAVLLDLDGTLVDSTAAVDRMWTVLSHDLGRDPATLVGQFHGMPVPQALRLIDPAMPESRIEELSDRMLELEVREVDDVAAAPGAPAFLDALPPDRWAVVTSGIRRLASGRLRAAGLPVPTVMVCADDVERGKPDPGPFLRAARLLGQPAAACLAIEDAPAGVRAAVAAGCQVLGLRTTHDRLDCLTVPDLGSASVRTLGSGGLVVDLGPAGVLPGGEMAPD